MSKHQIEVELRGPLNEQQYKWLTEYLSKHASLPSRENRFLIDYSTFIEGVGNRKLDVRTRVTNGHVELVVKRGAFGGASREEAIVVVADGKLDRAISLLALLGYTKGVACDRGIARYSLGEIEIAIQDVRIYGKPQTVHSRFYEAEILSDSESKDKSEEKLRQFLGQLNLSPYTPNEWYSYVGLINKEANGVFDFDKDSVESLKLLGQAPSA